MRSKKDKDKNLGNYIVKTLDGCLEEIANVGTSINKLILYIWIVSVEKELSFSLVQVQVCLKMKAQVK